MKHYNLDEDEVVLFKGFVLRDSRNEAELLLTNKKFFFITTIKRLFSEDVISVEEYSINEVKEYNGTYQVLKKGNKIEVYFLHNEVEFEFVKGNDCRDFMNSVLKLLTGKNKFERGAEKFFKGKDCVDNSLHIDSVELAKKTAGFVLSKGITNKLGFIKNKQDKKTID